MSKNLLNVYLIICFITLFCPLIGSNVPVFRLNSGRDLPVVGIGMGGFRTGGPPQGPLVRDIIRTAIDAGYRHIDTARGYHNEEAIGQAVSELIAEGRVKREDLFITTKIYSIRDNRENRTRGRADALNEVRLSLEKLNTSYIDLMLIHYPSTREENRESWKGLEDALNKGLVKSIGVSNFDIPLLRSLFRTANVFPAVDQVESHPMKAQKELQDYSSRYKIRLTAWSPLGAGRLVTDPMISAVGEKYNKTAAQVMIRWHIQRGFAAIPKSTNEQRIRENFNVFDFALTEEDMEVLNKMQN